MQFNADGLLPPDDYQMTFPELRNSILVEGPGGDEPWDRDWRMYLVNNLHIMVKQLWEVGITKIFIDGSFVENKAHPNDIDGYFECELQDIVSGTLVRALNFLDPKKIWTWDRSSRRPYLNYTKAQLPMWHAYRVELYPHYGNGPTTGICDKTGHNLLFPAAFRQTRDTFIHKGIIQIIK
ncbi:hypothetical protein B5M42_008850 [Paenibacillus athensensis]|uniref:Uncharacterized protein n=1 Tax=Paenibacillus athensensis TaxID=1967502 RepID=A0A4Y8Q9Y1_9BACL|nr:hypothetical protein [Paenibacillus athensensis]MCD1258944.1 hypothetical protein [Paenibacillus athensensis]